MTYGGHEMTCYPSLGLLPFPRKSRPEPGIVATPSLENIVSKEESPHSGIAVPAAPSLGELPFPRKSRPEPGIVATPSLEKMPYPKTTTTLR